MKDPNGANYFIFSNDFTGSFTGSFTGGGSGLTGVISTPAGSDKDIQFNDGDTSVSGSTNFTFDKTTNTFTISGSLKSSGSFVRGTTRITAVTYTLSTSDYRVGVSWTDSGSVDLQLPAISSVGEIEYKIKDEHGNCSNNNIHLLVNGSDTIDGEVTQSMAVDYMSVGVYNDGVSKWFIE
jgi:hypothetical protein